MIVTSAKWMDERKVNENSNFKTAANQKEKIGERESELSFKRC